MKHTFKVGDKIRMKESCEPVKKGEECVVGFYEDHLRAFADESLHTWGGFCDCQDNWLPLNNRGKNTRDPKTGRFIKMSHHKAVKLSSTLSGQRELLRNHENRLKELKTFIESLMKVVEAI